MMHLSADLSHLFDIYLSRFRLFAVLICPKYVGTPQIHCRFLAYLLFEYVLWEGYP